MTGFQLDVEIMPGKLRTRNSPYVPAGRIVEAGSKGAIGQKHSNIKKTMNAASGLSSK
jgi:hypothetical protein